MVKRVLSMGSRELDFKWIMSCFFEGKVQSVIDLKLTILLKSHKTSFSDQYRRWKPICCWPFSKVILAPTVLSSEPLKVSV